jgi:hypothetical protein
MMIDRITGAAVGDLSALLLWLVHVQSAKVGGMCTAVVVPKRRASVQVFYFVWFSSYDFWSTRSAILLASQTACRTRWPASHLPRNSAEFRATWLQPSAQDQMLEFFKALLAIFPRQTSYMRYNTHAAALCSRMHLAHLGHTWNKIKNKKNKRRGDTYVK